MRMRTRRLLAHNFLADKCAKSGKQADFHVAFLREHVLHIKKSFFVRKIHMRCRPFETVPEDNHSRDIFATGACRILRTGRSSLRAARNRDLTYFGPGIIQLEIVVVLGVRIACTTDTFFKFKLVVKMFLSDIRIARILIVGVHDHGKDHLSPVC